MVHRFITKYFEPNCCLLVCVYSVFFCCSLWLYLLNSQFLCAASCGLLWWHFFCHVVCFITSSLVRRHVFSCLSIGYNMGCMSPSCLEQLLLLQSSASSKHEWSGVLPQCVTRGFLEMRTKRGNFRKSRKQL